MSAKKQEVDILEEFGEVEDITDEDAPENVEQEITDKAVLAEVNYLKKTQEFYENLPESLPKSQSPDFLNDPLKFYQTILSQCSKGAELNALINKYLEAEASKKNEVRLRVISVYWNFIETLFEESFSAFTDELRYFIRYGMPVTSAVSGNILRIIKDTGLESDNPTSIYYIDEWLQEVSDGNVNQTIVDETTLTVDGLLASEKRKLEQLEIQKEWFTVDVENLSDNITSLFNDVVNIIEGLQGRPTIEGMDVVGPLKREHVESLKSIREKLSIVQQNSDEMENKLANITTTTTSIKKAQKNIASFEDQITKERKDEDLVETDEKEPIKHINNRIVYNEMQAVKQMMKASIGKRGNHFPILMKDFFSGPINTFGIRQHVLNELKAIETIDYTVFQRIIKNQVRRFFPIIILGPCYSSTGICWEPFEMSNRNNSTSKMLIPMYCQNLNKALVNALGDYRWQYAKERAGYNWMEEGLTGEFYLWHQENIKKGDLKTSFIEQYAIWIKWESNGAQKLDKDLRFVFWKYIPFPGSVKKSLSERSNVYAEMIRKEEQWKARQRY